MIKFQIHFYVFDIWFITTKMASKNQKFRVFLFDFYHYYIYVSIIFKKYFNFKKQTLNFRNDCRLKNNVNKLFKV